MLLPSNGSTTAYSSGLGSVSNATALVVDEAKGDFEAEIKSDKGDFEAELKSDEGDFDAEPAAVEGNFEADATGNFEALSKSPTALIVVTVSEPDASMPVTALVSSLPNPSSPSLQDTLPSPRDAGTFSTGLSMLVGSE